MHSYKVDPVNDFLNYMGKHHPDLFNEKEEQYYGIRKWNAQRRLENILASSFELHDFVQAHFQQVKKDYETSMKEGVGKKRKNDCSVQINRLNDILDKRERIFQEYDKNLETSSKQEYSSALLKYKHKFHLWNFNMNILRKELLKIDNLKKKRIVQKLHLKYQDCQNEFYNHNWRLVFSRASLKKFQNKGLELLDLLGYGNEGFVKGFEKYNPNTGKFDTYIVWWIDQMIRRGLAYYANPIRVSTRQQPLIFKLRRTLKALTQKYKRPVRLDEIIHSIPNDKHRQDNLSAVKTAFILMGGIKSLDAPLSNYNGELTIGDLLESTYQSPNLIVERKDQNNAINELVKNLSGRNKLIIELRFGLNGNKPHTLEELGNILNLSSERVRQIIEKNIFKRLRTKLSVYNE